MTHMMFTCILANTSLDCGFRKLAKLNKIHVLHGYMFYVLAWCMNTENFHQFNYKKGLKTNNTICQANNACNAGWFMHIRPRVETFLSIYYIKLSCHKRSPSMTAGARNFKWLKWGELYFFAMRIWRSKKTLNVRSPRSLCNSTIKALVYVYSSCTSIFFWLV